LSRAKKAPRRRSSADSSKTKTTNAQPRRRAAPSARRVEAPEEPSLEVAPPPPLEVVEHDPVVPLATPEPGMAARVPPPGPDRPYPDRRRAIFFDVENTSRAEHIARVIEHLAVDRASARTEFIAVGNWRVIGHDAARLLARHGAQLVHSAPSVGVRDWSDLRIAVGAGVWLAAARAGDIIELVSDDRAFDAVGDVASSLGITFRRLSFRRLAGMRPGSPVAEAVAAEAVVAEAPREAQPRGAGGHGRRRGRRGGRGGRDRRERDRGPRPAPAPPPVMHAAPTGASVASDTEPAVEPHTAPLDEIVGVVQELVERTADRSVSIDTLANALKSRGFRRPPGSPRLITRLRRIREITIDRAGRITLLDGGGGEAPPPAPPRPARLPEPEEELATVNEPNGNRAAPPDRGPSEEPEDEPMPGNVRGQETHVLTTTGILTGAQGDNRRRRSRRGGRGRRHGRSGAGAAP